jgi:hypothetical protein
MHIFTRTFLIVALILCGTAKRANVSNYDILPSNRQVNQLITECLEGSYILNEILALYNTFNNITILHR